MKNIKDNKVITISHHHQNILSFQDRQRLNNYFEYKWDNDKQVYYLFNPITGEYISETNYEAIDRSKSFWIKPIYSDEGFNKVSLESIISNNVKCVMLNSEPYQSRLTYFDHLHTGNSLNNGFEDNYAATLISSLIRGFLVRQSFRKYMSQRYCKILDKSSGYYYFQDNFDLNQPTTWHKPTLAFIEDISVSEVVEDPDDYMDGQKFTYQSKLRGPFIKLERLGKGQRERATHNAFITDNTLREVAISKHEDINLELATLGDILIWLEGVAVNMVTLSEYGLMRAVECRNNNWELILKYMNDNVGNERIQLYGLFSFAKLEVPIEEETGLLHKVTFYQSNLLIEC